MLRNWTELWRCYNGLKGRVILTHLTMCYMRGKGCSHIQYFMQFSSTHLSTGPSRNSHSSCMLIDSGLKQLKLLLFKKQFVHVKVSIDYKFQNKVLEKQLILIWNRNIYYIPLFLLKWYIKCANYILTDGWWLYIHQRFIKV